MKPPKLASLCTRINKRFQYFIKTTTSFNYLTARRWSFFVLNICIKTIKLAFIPHFMKFQAHSMKRRPVRVHHSKDKHENLFYDGEKFLSSKLYKSENFHFEQSGFYKTLRTSQWWSWSFWWHKWVLTPRWTWWFLYLSSPWNYCFANFYIIKNMHRYRSESFGKISRINSSRVN